MNVLVKSSKKVAGLYKIIICSILHLKQWMAATAPLKKSPCMKEWMAQADPSKVPRKEN